MMSDSSQTLQDPSTLNKPNTYNSHQFTIHEDLVMTILQII